MPEALGKIEKPEARSFGGNRKLIYVPLVLAAPDSDPELSALVDLFWQEASVQVESLAAGLGKVDALFHELIDHEESMLEVLGSLHSDSLPLVKKMMERGTAARIIEEPETLNEFMDWSRCLAMGLQSASVFDTVYQNYVKSQQKRTELMAARIDQGLKENETGLLMLREGHHVQYAADIQVFYVAPPSLDAIHRHLRERYENRSQQEQQTDAGCAGESEQPVAEGGHEEPAGADQAA
jgi:hypothetical protein